MNPEETPQETTPDNPLSQIRTYQGDVASALDTQSESLISIQQRESERRRATGEMSPPEHTGRERTVLLVVGAILLLVLGGTGGWYTYQEFIKKTTLPAPTVSLNRFVSVLEESKLEVSSTTPRSNLIKLIREKTDASLPSGEIRHIVLQESTSAESSLISTQTLMRNLETRAPSSLIRNFDELFMLGTIGTETQSNFLIIKLASYENVFAGMLAWENHIAQDIGPLFQTSDQLRDIPSPNTFTDIITRNKDARALLDPLGEVVLLYSFLDNNTMIITDNLEALRVIITRLNAESLTR